jgi:hypothetical protein
MNYPSVLEIVQTWCILICVYFFLVAHNRMRV